MKLIEASTRNPVKVAVGVLLVVLFGLLGLMRMPVQLIPEVEFPTITINSRWPGASPEEVEREIIQQQEEQLKRVEGVTKMTSECGDSGGSVTLEFQVGTSLSEALIKVNSRLQQVREYPEDADEPVITTGATAEDQMIALYILRLRTPKPDEITAFLAVDENRDLREVFKPVQRARSPQLAYYRLANVVKEHPELGERVRSLLPPPMEIHTVGAFAEEVIETRFARVPGVGRANIFGGREEEMRVIVDPERLSAHGLTIMNLRRALREQNHDITAGDLLDGKRRYVIRTLSRFRNEEQVAAVIVGCGRNRAPTYLRDLAEVQLGYKKPMGIVRNFSTTCLTAGCRRQLGANVVETVDRIRNVVKELNAGVLKQRGLELVLMFDETEHIHAALRLLNGNIIVGSLLTVGVLLLFLRSGRPTLVLAVTIPISVIGTFLMLKLLGRSLNIVSLAGLAFAVGMVVDNAIVVLENIFRRCQAGEEPFSAAARGTTEVWGAVLASTLTTLAVFVPVLFVQEEAGQLFRDIAIAISSAVALSLIVAITVIPAAAARILKPAKTATGRLAVSPTRRLAHSALLQWADTVAEKFTGAVMAVNDRLQRSIRLRVITVLLFTGGSFLFSYFLMPKVEYLPSGTRNQVVGQVVPPTGYNIDKLLDFGKKLEEDGRPYWDLDAGADSGKGLDYPPVDDYFVFPTGDRIYFGYRAIDPMRAGELVPLVQKLGAQFPGALTFATRTSLFTSGVGGSRSVDIEVTGPDLHKLIRLAQGIFEQVPEVVPGSRAFPNPSLDLSSPQLHVIPKRERSAQMQIPAADLGYALGALVDGVYATDFYLRGRKIDLTIMAGEPTSLHRVSVRGAQDLPGLAVHTPAGKLSPLEALADVVFAGSAERILRRERQRAMGIGVSPPEEMPLQEAIERIEAGIVQPLRQAGKIGGAYEIRLSGTADKLSATWQALRWNLVLALLITYLLMAGLFESWLYPLVIMFSVPFAAVGGILGLAGLNLYLALWPHRTVQSLDMITMLGFVILIGIVVNNAILIVHQSLNHMREDGMAPDRAILASVQGRIRPIFMTTLTTIFGLLPLVLFPGQGSELYRGLGAVVLGGLAVSTLFTLVLVPAVFTLALEAKAALLRRARAMT